MNMRIISLLSACVLVVCAGFFLGFGGCAEKKKTSIIIPDGQYSEMYLIHHMVKLLVEAHTPLKVEIRDEMTPLHGFKQLIQGNVDLVNSYDGTLLTTLLGYDPRDVPEGESLYEFVNEIAIRKHDVRLLDKLGINNTYAVAVHPDLAKKHGLENVSDLEPIAGDLVFGAEHSFFSLEGSAHFKPFAAFYNLKFKDTKPIDLGLKYYAIDSGNIDVTVAYATDGMNKKTGLKILRDDKAFFPEYNGALMVRNGLFEEVKDIAPNLEEVLNRLGGIFTDEIMTDLTYAVDVEERKPADVAREFLREKGMIP